MEIIKKIISEYITARVAVVLLPFVASLGFLRVLGDKSVYYVVVVFPLLCFLALGVIHMIIDPPTAFILGFMAVILMFFGFYEWNRKVEIWFPKSNFAFRRLIPELRYSIKALIALEQFYLGWEVNNPWDPLMLSEEQIEDNSRAEQLVQRLHFMEIVYASAPTELGGKESRQKWREHFQRTLSYAERGKYKDYVKLLRKEKEATPLTEDDVPF